MKKVKGEKEVRLNQTVCANMRLALMYPYAWATKNPPTFKIAPGQKKVAETHKH